jgi:uncharacterized protein YdaU (DUF1376 family)
MSSPDTWMPLYVGRYLADTGHLTVCEHGAYVLLLMHYWCNGPLPDDDKQLATIARTERKAWDRVVGPALRPFFRLVDGKLHQKRADIELTKAKEISAKKRAAAGARWDNKPAPTKPPNGSGDHASGHAYASARAGPSGHAGGGPSAYAGDTVVHMPVPVPSPREDIRFLGEETRARANPSEVKAVAASAVKALKVEKPPYTPSRDYQLAALVDAKPLPQPQDPVRSVEEQLAILHAAMANDDRSAA